MDGAVVVQAALGRHLRCLGDARRANRMLVADALAAWDAGAAVLRVTASEADDAGDGLWVRFAEVVDEIRAAGCDAILALDVPLIALASLGRSSVTPGAELVSLDCRSAGLVGEDAVRQAYRREALTALAQAGISAELRCSTPRDVEQAMELRDGSLLTDPLRFELLIEAWASEGAAVEQLARTISALPAGAIWSAGAAGLDQLAVNLYALVAQGHLRTGLEDNPWLVQDVPATDEELVQRLVRIVDEFDRPLAPPNEAREELGLDGLPRSGDDMELFRGHRVIHLDGHPAASRG